MMDCIYKKSPLISFVGLCILAMTYILIILYFGKSSHHKSHSAETPCSSDTDDPDIDDIPEIPGFMFTYIDTIVEQDKFQLPQCQSERVNFVYIKTHKCASDTLAAMWRRFALTRNLSVVVPILGKFLLGWPHTFQYFMHRPSKHKGGYNILLDHVVFDHSYISSIMPDNSVYFTSVREPFARLGSALLYHGMKKCGRMPSGR